MIEGIDVDIVLCSGCPYFERGTNYPINSASEEPNDPPECNAVDEVDCVRWLSEP